MYAHAADLHRNGLHSESRLVAGNQQVTNLDWTITGVYLHFHASRCRHKHTSFAALAKRDSRLQRDHTRNTAVVGLRRSNYLIIFVWIENYYGAGGQRLGRLNPLRYVLVFGLNGAAGDDSAGIDITHNIKFL